MLEPHLRLNILCTCPIELRHQPYKVGHDLGIPWICSLCFWLKMLKSDLFSNHLDYTGHFWTWLYDQPRHNASQYCSQWLRCQWSRTHMGRKASGMVFFRLWASTALSRESSKTAWTLALFEQWYYFVTVLLFIYQDESSPVRDGCYRQNWEIQQ